jgi:DNA-binding MarR family transcriptional regulator
MDRAELTKEIIELQRQINRDIRQHTLEAWMGLNITAPQLKTMFFIANQGSTNFTKLALALGVTPPNVTGIVDRLVEHGLVSRQENPEDRRMLMLHLTEKGKSIIADLRERRASRMSKILSNLSLEELATVAKGFNLLNRAAELQRGKKRE